MKAKLLNDKYSNYKKKLYGKKDEIVTIISSKEEVEDETNTCLLVKGKTESFPIRKDEVEIFDTGLH